MEVFSMRKLLVGLSAGLVLLAGAGPALAEVNCKLVQKDMSMGRTAEDIAERMGASVEDVKKCATDANAGTAGDKAGSGTGTVAPGAATGAADKGDADGGH
jgi:hypothetical protein